MAKTFLARLPLVALVLVACVLLAAPESGAQSLDAARASGQVGERYDGLLVVRQPNAPAGVRALVDSVNKQRSGIYAKRAAQQKVSPTQVGKLYASQIAEKAPAGTWFLLENGQWKKK